MLLDLFSSSSDEDETEDEEVTFLPPNTEHLYIWRTDKNGEPIPDMKDVTVYLEWQELIDKVKENHFKNKDSVKAVFYPCAPIQCIDA